MSTSSVWSQESYPILPNTTKIIYSTKSTAGASFETSYTIYEDSLVWNHEIIFHTNQKVFKYRDVCKYDKGVFKNLLNKLSSIHFTIEPFINENVANLSGGTTRNYTFANEKGQYLTYYNWSVLSGDYKELSKLIRIFIAKHKTEGEKLLNRHKSGSKEEDSGMELDLDLDIDFIDY